MRESSCVRWSHMPLKRSVNHPMWTDTEVAWMAGLLECRGSFHCSPDARDIAVYLRIMDRDVAERFAELVREKVHQYRIKPGKEMFKASEGKLYYCVNARVHVVALMTALKPHMSARRSAAIADCLVRYSSHHARPRIGRGRNRRSVVEVVKLLADLNQHEL